MSLKKRSGIIRRHQEEKNLKRRSSALWNMSKVIRLVSCKVNTNLSWVGRSNGTLGARFRDQSNAGLKLLDGTPSTSKTYVSSGRAGNREGWVKGSTFISDIHH